MIEWVIRIALGVVGLMAIGLAWMMVYAAWDAATGEWMNRGRAEVTKLTTNGEASVEVKHNGRGISMKIGRKQWSDLSEGQFVTIAEWVGGNTGPTGKYAILTL